ncbi:hypothetical protein LCGC14_2240400, partial [marine sediment metagenome]
CYTDAENFFIKVQEYFESTSFDEVEINIKRQRMHNLYPNGVNILLMAQIELSILYSSVLVKFDKKEKIIKKCACKRKYTMTEWKKLRYVGEMKGIGNQIAQLRDCSCGSTLMLLLSQIKKEET